MDPRRRLISIPPVAAAAALSACAHPPAAGALPTPAALAGAPATDPVQRPASPAGVHGSPNGGPIPYLAAWRTAPPERLPSRRGAVDARVQVGAAPEPPSSDRRDGALRILGYAPGRIYKVQAAPFRVTSLTLEPGERLIDKAAGDTVRWQIGETTTGSGEAARTLVLIKPFSAGLSTNMVLATSRRVYLLDLVSTAKGFDPAIAWSYPVDPARASAASGGDAPSEPPIQVSANRYRVTPKGRSPSWSPRAVFDDGRRTYIAFPPDIDRGPAPVLLVEDGEGRAGLVNYRLSGSLLIADRLFDRAELRLGARRPSVVQIVRLPSEERR